MHITTEGTEITEKMPMNSISVSSVFSVVVILLKGLLCPNR